MSKTWQGFDDRMFLTEEEWRTYLRRPPVRYVGKTIASRAKICEVCGKQGPECKLQVSHKIPFSAVLKFGFTPDWLDRAENLIWACQRECNKNTEMSFAQIEEFLKSNDILLPRFIVENRNIKV